MNFKNFTPHVINVVAKGSNGGTEVKTWDSIGIARVGVETVITGSAVEWSYENNFDRDEFQIPFLSETFGEVTGLPAPEIDTFFIVSRMVADALLKRNDLVCPVGLVRDEKGQVIGCSGFSTPKQKAIEIINKEEKKEEEPICNCGSGAIRSLCFREDTDKYCG